MKNIKICVIGLGYVGLPLACEFGKKFPTLGYDKDKNRITNLKAGIDETLEVTTNQLKKVSKINFTCKIADAKDCNYFIVTVPTPITNNKKPDLRLIKRATIDIAKILKSNDIVIYESTFYPGTVEELCVPLLEKYSNLKYNRDFYCGYSPERINPGDKIHTIRKIIKITSGSNAKTANKVDYLYNQIIDAGTYKAESIKVAEAAKVIENIQRDLNIALTNELAIVFDKMDINTSDVLNAAKTKWNFHNYTPGFVGGHCIGVDPYYLTYAAIKRGFIPKVILSGRSINENVPNFFIKKILIKCRLKEIKLKGAKVLVMGYTFKENCPDTRNTKVYDFTKKLISKNLKVDITDPYLINQKVKIPSGTKIINSPLKNHYDIIVMAVPHKVFLKLGTKVILSYAKKNSVICDVKNVLNRDIVDVSL
tara:strand:+ start:177 stop:1445 length:1269 start_codon:yes stop_codon:yes gene_type:complete